MSEMYSIAVLIISGIFFAKLISGLKFPNVTAYLIVGLLIGPSVLGILSEDNVNSMAIISEVALSFIAFSIGSEMNLKKIRQIGSKILLVTFFEAIGAFIVVSLGLVFIFKTSWSFAIVLASISCATAPAATLMVINQYKAKGEIVDILIPVVALDDAVGIIIFGITSSIAIAIESGKNISMVEMILLPVWEIVFALGLGSIVGIIFILLAKRMRNDEELFSFNIAVIFGTTALALYLELSSLLTIMAMGIVIGNLGQSNRRGQDLIGKITPPIFICFFVLSGADLDLSSLISIGSIGSFYVLGRSAGKIAGSYFSTKMVGFSKEIQRYLGLTLIPQAGVAIGLSLIALKILPVEAGTRIRNIVLAATIVYELVGPLLAKYALKKAGAIK